MRKRREVRKLGSIGTFFLFSLTLCAQAPTGEGERWLGMNSDTQTGFVFGYTIGLSKGYEQGCLAYQKFEPEERTLHPISDDASLKCSRHGFGFSKPVSFYVEEITKFYRASAEDRKVPFEEVLKKLSDHEHLTPEQMHEWFKQHGWGKFRH